jgi:uncharacterized protein YlzI (FlbEa/FlbD family)
MLEYTEYSKSAPIAINPKYVVTIEPDGSSWTRITLVSGKTVIIQGEYDKIIEHFIKF